MLIAKPSNSCASSCARSRLRFATIMRRRPCASQVARGERDRFARADQQRGVIREVLEDRARQRHRGGGDRYRVRADARLRAHALGDRERRLHQPVQVRPGDPLVVRRAVGVLQLAEDLRLAEHQRIQPAGDRRTRAGSPACRSVGTGFRKYPACGPSGRASLLSHGDQRMLASPSLKQYSSVRLQVETISASRTPATPLSSCSASGSSSPAKTTFSRISTGAVR